jgi:hypothetical protein
MELNVKKAGFNNIEEEYVSRLTFPSLVIYAEKPVTDIA